MALKGRLTVDGGLAFILIIAHHLPDPASSLYKLVDGAVSPDPYYTKDYEVEHRGKGTPLIIDNGMWSASLLILQLSVCKCSCGKLPLKMG